MLWFTPPEVPTENTLLVGSVSLKNWLEVDTLALVSGATSLTLNSRITLTSGGNDSARTATITGKDLYGNTVTEEVPMGNAAAVTSTKVFKSVTSITFGLLNLSVPP